MSIQVTIADIGGIIAGMIFSGITLFMCGLYFGAAAYRDVSHAANEKRKTEE